MPGAECVGGREGPSFSQKDIDIGHSGWQKADGRRRIGRRTSGRRVLRTKDGTRPAPRSAVTVFCPLPSGLSSAVCRLPSVVIVVRHAEILRISDTVCRVHFESRKTDAIFFVTL